MKILLKQRMPKKQAYKETKLGLVTADTAVHFMSESGVALA